MYNYFFAGRNLLTLIPPKSKWDANWIQPKYMLENVDFLLFLSLNFFPAKKYIHGNFIIIASLRRVRALISAHNAKRREINATARSRPLTKPSTVSNSLSTKNLDVDGVLPEELQERQKEIIVFHNVDEREN